MSSAYSHPGILSATKLGPHSQFAKIKNPKIWIWEHSLMASLKLTASSPLKIDGTRRRSFPFQMHAIFSGANLLFVSGRVFISKKTQDGTNISPTKGTFKDDFPFSQVGYVSSLGIPGWFLETCHQVSGIPQLIVIDAVGRQAVRDARQDVMTASSSTQAKRGRYPPR